MCHYYKMMSLTYKMKLATSFINVKCKTDTLFSDVMKLTLCKLHWRDRSDRQHLDIITSTYNTQTTDTLFCMAQPIPQWPCPSSQHWHCTGHTVDTGECPLLSCTGQPGVCSSNGKQHSICKYDAVTTLYQLAAILAVSVWLSDLILYYLGLAVSDMH